MAINRGKERAKERGLKQDTILKDIILINENNNPTQTDINKLIELQSELDNIYQNLRGAFVRSRRQWMEHEKRNTKCFHNLEKGNATINNR